MGHHHHHPQTFNRAFALAVGANLTFALVQGGYAIAAHSMSLLADAVHNLGDVLGLMLAWFANYLLTKRPTDRYSYGFKRSSILAALANALILIATSSVIFYESIHKLVHPVAVNELVIVVVALIGIVINGSTALMFLRGRHHDLNIRGAFIHLAADTLISVGVVLSGLVILLTGWFRLDPSVAILIVVFVVYGTYGLLRDAINLILDGVPHHIDAAGVKAYLRALPGVDDVHDMHIWGLSTRDVALTAHLVLAEDPLASVDYAEINHVLEETFGVHHATLQIEKGPCVTGKC